MWLLLLQPNMNQHLRKKRGDICNTFNPKDKRKRQKKDCFFLLHLLKYHVPGFAQGTSFIKLMCVQPAGNKQSSLEQPLLPFVAHSWPLSLSFGHFCSLLKHGIQQRKFLFFIFQPSHDLHALRLPSSPQHPEPCLALTDMVHQSGSLSQHSLKPPSSLGVLP